MSNTIEIIEIEDSAESGSKEHPEGADRGGYNLTLKKSISVTTVYGVITFSVEETEGKHPNSWDWETMVRVDSSDCEVRSLLRSIAYGIDVPWSDDYYDSNRIAIRAIRDFFQGLDPEDDRLVKLSSIRKKTRLKEKKKFLNSLKLKKPTLHEDGFWRVKFAGRTIPVDDVGPCIDDGLFSMIAMDLLEDPDIVKAYSQYRKSLHEMVKKCEARPETKNLRLEMARDNLTRMINELKGAEFLTEEDVISVWRLREIKQVMEA